MPGPYSQDEHDDAAGCLAVAVLVMICVLAATLIPRAITALAVAIGAAIVIATCALG